MGVVVCLIHGFELVVSAMNGQRRETVTIHSSSDDVDKLSLSVDSMVYSPDCADVVIVANLYSQKAKDADHHLVDRQILVRPSFPVEIEFRTEIRNTGLNSVVELVLSSVTESRLLGRVVLPVFTSRGLLMRGTHLFPIDLGVRSDQVEIFDGSVRRCQELETTNEKLVRQNQNLAVNIHDFHLVRSGVVGATEAAVLAGLDHYLILTVNGSKPLTVYSDTFKASPQFIRQTSMAEAVLSARTPTAPVELLTTPTNWLVVNGAIRVDNTAPSKYAGTGSIPTSDVTSSLSPSPIQIIEYELFKEHPAAAKSARIHRATARAKIPSKLSVQARPNADEMARLNDVILQPMRALSQSEVELVLKYMWSLTGKKLALLKVLLAVAATGLDGLDLVVADLLSAWTPVDVDGALALLGQEIGALHPNISSLVRAYAVKRLAQVATKRELQLYMFLVVQSLRYEPAAPDDGLSTFLIDRSSRDPELAALLFWYLQCETAPEESVGGSLSRLVGLGRGSPDSGASQFTKIGQQFWRELGKTELGRSIRDGIELQCQFRMRLLDVAQTLRVTRFGGADSAFANRSEILREALRGNLPPSGGASSIISKLNLTNKLNFPIVGSEVVEIPIPLDPLLALVRVDETKSFCIKSAQAPFVLSCEVFNQITKMSETKRYMFKTGDDLRQDQLVIQFISIIDGLLKSYGLDLKLTPYRVLATSVDDGFVEFVSDSSTLSSILAANNNDLLTYFRSVRPNSVNGSAFGIDPSVLDTFSRSCAGYCAITYILGIGDRHMDNLLVTSDGRLFHVDFGYILGRDPKPFPPPMKLCREMVEGMGGAGSVYYRSFVSKCTQAFLIMRRHANLLISLLYLAADANLKDMTEQDPKLAILKVQKRLMLEVSDEVAEQQMINLINESTNALFPVMIEKLHKWAIYWRQ